MTQGKKKGAIQPPVYWYVTEKGVRYLAGLVADQEKLSGKDRTMFIRAEVLDWKQAKQNFAERGAKPGDSLIPPLRPKAKVKAEAKLRVTTGDTMLKEGDTDNLVYRTEGGNHEES